MSTAAAHDNEIKRRFMEEGQTDSQIAAALGLTKGAIVGRRHRLGIFRDGFTRPPYSHGEQRKPVISDAEARERKIDLRDLTILSDLADGHSRSDVARYYNVDPTYIKQLHTEASQQ